MVIVTRLYDRRHMYGGDECWLKLLLRVTPESNLTIETAHSFSITINGERYIVANDWKMEYSNHRSRPFTNTEYMLLTGLLRRC